MIEIPADPEKGFNFPYLLFTPEAPKGDVLQYPLVEPNNTGQAYDCPEAHHEAAIDTAKGIGGGGGYYVATQLGIPLLVPVFPRPRNVYIQSLNRDTILIRDGPLRRIDWQLIAMVEDAKRRLAKLGRPVNDKILMIGFSASGMFVNRFTFLHPKVVAAAAYGGVNGFIMVPLKEMRNEKQTPWRLEFPIGLADYDSEDITGHPFDEEVYKQIHQFVYMGADDVNDAISPPYNDAYPEQERSLVWELFGQTMMPDRWVAVQKVYPRAKWPRVEFKKFDKIGHKIDKTTNDEVKKFFRRIIQQSPKTSPGG